jgi:hypothetical protein
MRNPNATYYTRPEEYSFRIIFFYNPFLHEVLLTGLRCTGRVFVEKLTPPTRHFYTLFGWYIDRLKKSKRVVWDPY